MKRVALFLATNIAILVVLSVVVQLLGLEPVLADGGLNLGSLLAFSAVFGMGGAFISLAMSKWSAKRMVGAHVIEQPSSEVERWLVETVRRQAQAAGIGMPEVAIYEAPEVNAFATGMSRNNALVAVSTGSLARHGAQRGGGGAGARGLPRRQRRHGDADADPGRGQHLRHVPLARHRPRRRPRRLQDRARPRSGLLHHPDRGADGARHPRLDHRLLVLAPARVPRRRRRCRPDPGATR